MIHDYARYDRVRAVAFKGDRLELLDQRGLPFRQDFIACENADAVAEAIFQLIVRGAPAIGIAAAWGVVLAANGLPASTEAQTARQALAPVLEDCNGCVPCWKFPARISASVCAPRPMPSRRKTSPRTATWARSVRP